MDLRRPATRFVISLLAAGLLVACGEVPIPPIGVGDPIAQPPAPQDPTAAPSQTATPSPSPSDDAEGELIMKIDFETGDYSQVDQRQYQSQRCKDGQDYIDNSLFQIVDEPVGAGDFASLVHLEPCDERAEYVVQGSFLEADTTYRVRYQMMMPDNFNPEGARGALVQQLGAVYRGFDSGQAEIANDCGNPHASTMRLSQDELFYRVRFPDGRQGGKTILGCRDYPMTAMVPGRWADLEIRVRFSEGDEGFLHIFQDGDQVVDFEGPLLWEGYGRPGDLKIGAYTGDPGPGVINLYFDEIIVERLG